MVFLFYTYLQKNPYDRRTLFKLLLLGHFDIGVARIGSYHLIKDITPYSDEANSEINLHYMYPRYEPSNVAWRSINWDLFAPMVDQINEISQQQSEDYKRWTQTQLIDEL